MNRPDRTPGVRLVTDRGIRPLVSIGDLDAIREINALLEAAKPDREVICLLSRLTAGLGVQALWSPTDNTTWITVALNGETETIEVSPALLREAFNHPYAYGATLKL